MGFLLGKSDAETLTTFETVNQDVSFDDFRDPQRSINKAAQSYVFPEKGEFDYEFNFMTETEYSNLLEMVTNRNSLKDGLLLVPIPFSESPTACILKAKATAADKVYKLDAMSTAPWLTAAGSITKAEISETEYGYINAYDANIVSDSNHSADYSGFIFDYNIAPFITAFGSKYLRRFTFPFIGQKTSSYRFFIWSPSKSAWFWIQDKFCYDASLLATDAYTKYKQNCVSFCVPYGCDSLYADFSETSGTDRLVKIMVCSDRINQAMTVQYARLLVNGYLTIPPGRKEFENYSVAFTGAGRAGRLTLSEV